MVARILNFPASQSAPLPVAAGLRACRIGSSIAETRERPLRTPLISRRRTVFALVFAVVCELSCLRCWAAESFEASAHAAHEMLTRLCDDFGGRLTGSAANEGALQQLATELRTLGLKPEIDRFTMPGWERGADRVDLISPVARPLRVAALSYTQPHDAFEAEVAYIGTGKATDYPADVQGKILLLSSASTLSAAEYSRIAIDHGARGILFINREGGGQLLARTGSMTGETLPLPVYSVTQEEGLWLARLLARNRTVRVRMETHSHCRDVETANLRVSLPGRAPGRIIVGAHFDSWDLGQGALDNGLGTAQIFALALALRGRDLPHGVDLVWFNGEEQGMWGSRHDVKRIRDTPVIAMINLDMVGVPIAVNALGDASLVPSLERWNAGRGDRKLPLGVQNINWFGSDHTSYQVAGIRAITFNAPIPRESVRYYHDLADTIDKLPEQIVVDSTAIIGDVLLSLLSDPSLEPFRRDRAETEKLFTAFGIEHRMQAAGWWPLKP